MDVKQAIEQHLEMDNERINSAIECTARLAAKAATSLNEVERRLDEESFTAAFFGALAASLPLSVLAYSRQEGEDYAWLKYDKSSGSWPESESGADFCLVFDLSTLKSRMAIFQAKSDSSKGATNNTLVLNHSRKEQGEEVLQVKRLVETASRISSEGGADQVAWNELGWIHYLCQFESGLRCVPISKIGGQVEQIIKGIPSVKKSISVNKDNGILFTDVIADAFGESSTYWRNIGRSELSSLPSAIRLTEIGQLMKIYVFTDDLNGWVNSLDASSPTVVSKVKAINKNNGFREKVGRKRENSSGKKGASNQVVAKKGDSIRGKL